MDFEKRLKELEAENRSLRQTVDARNCELDVLHELSENLGKSLNDNDLFTTLFSNISQCIRVDLAIGLLASPDVSPQLFVHGTKSFADDALQELLEKICAGLSMMGGSTVVPAALVNALRKANPHTQLEAAPTIGSFFQVPILSAGGVVGVIALADQQTEHFLEEQIRLVYTVANQASTAVEGINELHAHESRRLQSIVDNLPDGVILLDSNRVPTKANPTAKRLLNVQCEVSSGQDVLKSDALDSLEQRHFDQAEDLGHCIVERDILVGDSDRRLLEPHLIRLPERQLAESWMVVLKDVTESRMAVKRRDEFLAMLAHELRNPLSPILNAVQIISMPHPKAAVRDKALEIADRQAKHMAGIVDDLLEVSRFLHGKIVLRRTVGRLDTLVTEVAAGFRAQAQQQELKLNIRSSETPLYAEIDTNRMTQVISNLLGNAIKYTPAGGTVDIEVRGDGGEALIIITDTGVGLNPDELRSVFEPFMQVAASLARSQGGLGLGLALVNMIVQQHDGSIHAESEGQGKGTVFTVRLPLCQPVSGCEPGATDQSHHLSQGASILLVEDNRDAREMQTSLLELFGYSVITAEDGEEGVSQFKRHQPDICLIDIGLPKMSGFQVASAIRELAGKDVTLIALTGYSQRDMQESFDIAGFDRHIMKPVDVDRLQEILDECISCRSS